MILRSDDAALNLAADLDVLLGRLDAAAESETRTTALAAVTALTGLYDEAFRRLLRHVEQDGAATTALAQDPVVSHLLIAHALHPQSLYDRVQHALDQVRPYLRSHGGDVELLGIGENHARVRLHGSCRGCSASADTLRTRVEAAVLEAAPELSGVLTHTKDEPAGLVQLHGRDRNPTHQQASSAQCDLCSHPISATHRHLLDLNDRRLLCACRACALLFDQREAGGRHYRLVPERHQMLPRGLIDDALWAVLQIPVDVAFFFHSSAVGRSVAFYPGPAGATESLLGLTGWEELCRRVPELGTLEEDVEALLVCRVRELDCQWIVPIDCCYELTGLMRSHWRGLSGGEELWDTITTFFTSMEKQYG